MSHALHIVWLSFLYSMAAMSSLAVVSRFRKQSIWDQALTYKAEERALKEPYWHRCLVAFDQMINTFAAGNPAETISARCGRWAMKKTGFWGWRYLAKFMNAWLCGIQPDHGMKAAAGDLARCQYNSKVLQDALNEAIGQRGV